MARPLREQHAGGLYHVMARGVRRSPIYYDDADRVEWLSTLEEVVTLNEWRCHAYCLMTNHFHLVIETPKPNLSAGMHRLNSLHAQWINWRYKLQGHVFDRRFHSVLITTDPQLMVVARYLALNPERGRLCKRAIDWRWSSFRSTLELETRPSFLTCDRILAAFDDDADVAREMFRRFVELPVVAAA